ncbi:MAG: prepilin-type N-terminal cleavage/methylation domain-containing protein [Lentisphaerae bacterium]|nr:prepilin-type N-terminal cleavage/methylation domain-containing protein [Lentisphaerota bacterium]
MKKAGLSVGGGFTLLEIMLVVSLIGLLAVLAVPLVARAAMQARDAMFINDLRTLSGAFSQYALQNGDYPEDAPPGVLPEDVAPYLRGTDWADAAPVGGTWDWTRAPQRGQTVHGGYATLNLLAPRRTRTQMQAIDRDIDDGNLATGRFRGGPSRYTYIVETHW